MDDFYQILEIDETLSCQEISDYLRSLNNDYRMRSNHRDNVVREDALAKMELIRTARAALSDVEKRTAYDAELAGFRAAQSLSQPLADTDLYALFGLSHGATTEEIESELDTLAQSLDGENEIAVERIRALIVKARHTLLDSERRAAYDHELQERVAFASQRDEAKPVPLRANGAVVAQWSDLESALGEDRRFALELLQSGELEAWLRWSLNQRQRANWVGYLAQRCAVSDTPLMEVEELMRLSNPARPLHLYRPGQDASRGPLLSIPAADTLPQVADRQWADLVRLFIYVRDFALLDMNPDQLERYRSFPESDDVNIQLERLLFAIDPSLPPPKVELSGVDLEQGIDFGAVQSWSKPTVSFEIRSFGRGYLYGTITVSKSWLRVTPGTFAGEKTRFTVEPDTSQLASGQDQVATIHITTADGRGESLSFDVHTHQRTFFQSVKSWFDRG